MTTREARAGIDTSSPVQVGTADEDREFAFTTRDFVRVKRLIYARAGIALNDRKENMVYGRLARRLRACGIGSFSTYLDVLERDANSPEWQAFTNALTTNLTAFFREAHHFPILQEHLLARARRHGAVVWCAAASTGEEPYSIAIAACEAFDTLAPPVRIVASDIDTDVLQVARAAIYPLERLESMDAGRRHRYFQKGTGARAGFARVRPEVQGLVQFRRLNLLDDRWGIDQGLTAIFCRNVLIYFDRATQLRVVAQFAPLLESDGLLFAGHSESLGYASAFFQSRGNTVYEKTR